MCMVQRQKNFEKALKKGEMGEEYVREYMESRGYVVYFPFTKDRAHFFDMLCTHGKKAVIAIDVKTKPQMLMRRTLVLPGSTIPTSEIVTGINETHYQQYLSMQQRANIPFWLFFVDDLDRHVYAQNLQKLGKGVRFTNKKVDLRLWAIKSMVKVFCITKAECENLSKLDNRSYNKKFIH